MVEEDAVAGIHPVPFPVIPGHPVRVDLGAGIGAPRVKRRLLVLWGV